MCAYWNLPMCHKQAFIEDWFYVYCAHNVHTVPGPKYDTFLCNYHWNWCTNFTGTPVHKYLTQRICHQFFFSCFGTNQDDTFQYPNFLWRISCITDFILQPYDNVCTDIINQRFKICNAVFFINNMTDVVPYFSDIVCINQIHKPNT